MKFSCVIAILAMTSSHCAGNKTSEIESSLREMLATPDMQTFVQYLQKRAAKKSQAELIEDEGVMFDTCQACVDNFKELIKTYRIIGKAAFNSILKVHLMTICNVDQI